MAKHDDTWDFYPVETGGTPASIWINLRYRQATPADSNTLYWVRIAMVDTGDQQMGTEAEASRLWPIEDQLEQFVRSLQLEFVARVRERGTWEMTFYGSPGKQDELEARATTLDFGGRPVTCGSRTDVGWQHYKELLPSPERWQWMQDRRTVEVLQERGDRPNIPRRIDHWAYFPSETQRRAFVSDATVLGFKNDAANAPEASDEFAARVFRTECTVLDEIHTSVMQLCEIAARHCGYYDGWETSVEKGS